MFLFRWLIRLIAVLALLAGGVVLAARYSDGPLGPLPGGSLTSGPFVTKPVADWTLAEIGLAMAGEHGERGEHNVKGATDAH